MSSRDETKAIRDVLEGMNGALTNIEGQFENFNQGSSTLAAMGPTMQDASKEIEQTKEDLRAHTAAQQKWIKDIKKRTQTDLPEQIVGDLQQKIKEQVKAEIEKEVQEIANLQIKEYLPVSLQKQSEDCAAQINEIKKSLQNSGARRFNANLPASDLDEMLQVVLKADGQKSDLFPINLRSLFSYDNDMAKELVKEYGLPEDPVRETNLNRFMWHIGIRFHLHSTVSASGKA